MRKCYAICSIGKKRRSVLIEKFEVEEVMKNEFQTIGYDEPLNAILLYMQCPSRTISAMKPL
jgi:hypothetical protein